MPVPPHSSMAPSDEEWPGMILCMISGSKVWMQFLPILPIYYHVATIAIHMLLCCNMAAIVFLIYRYTHNPEGT